MQIRTPGGSGENQEIMLTSRRLFANQTPKYSMTPCWIQEAGRHTLYLLQQGNDLSSHKKDEKRKKTGASDMHAGRTDRPTASQLCCC